MSDNKPGKREPYPHPEQRLAKAPRLGDRWQDIYSPASISSSSFEFSDAPESFHSPDDPILRNPSSSAAASTSQVAPSIVEPASASDPTDTAFRLPRPHATATLHTSASNRDVQEELIHRAQPPRAWSGGVTPAISQASNAAVSKLTPLSSQSQHHPHRTTTRAVITAAVPLAAVTGNRGLAPQAPVATVPDQSGTRNAPIELRSSPPAEAYPQMGTTASAAGGYATAPQIPAHLVGQSVSSVPRAGAVTYYVEAHSPQPPSRRVRTPQDSKALTHRYLAQIAPASRALTPQAPTKHHHQIPNAQTLPAPAQAPIAPAQDSRAEVQTLNSQAQIPNGQAQHPVVTRRIPGPGRRLCKCACTRKDTCVLHSCCINGVPLTRAERDALANATNP